MIDIEKFGHKWTIDGPGTTRDKTHLRPIIPSHITCALDLCSDYSFQVYIRYGYIKAKVTGYMFNERQELYRKIQINRVGKEKLGEFDRLIGSFSEFGYSFQKYESIPTGLDMHILDGSHRLACCLFFNENPMIEQYDIDTHPYEILRLNTVCSPEELNMIAQSRSEVIEMKSKGNEESFVGFIRGDGLRFRNEIIHEFGEANLSRFFIKYYGGDKIKDAIKATYDGDGISEDRLDRKALILRHRSTSIGVVCIKNIIQLANITDIKKRIRGKLAPRISDYYFDSIIHIIDNPALGKHVLAKLGLGLNT